MHYDPGMVPELVNENYEFISNITTSVYLRKLLTRGAIKADRQQPLLATAAQPPSTKKVLIVDDNQINLKLAAEFINLWGHQPTMALHAQAAIAYYKQQSFDIVILDIQMPDIDGTELLKMMREAKPEDNVTFVALTANVLPQESARLLNIGFDYYLSKPIDEDKFRAILDGGDLEPELLDEKNADIEGRPKTDTPKTIDLEKSLVLSANNESILLQMFKILLREIPTHQSQLASALEVLDREKISSIIHKIHGITCYASLPDLRQLVLSIQRLMTDQPDQSINDLVEEIIIELENVKKETEILLKHKFNTSRQAQN